MIWKSSLSPFEFNRYNVSLLIESVNFFFKFVFKWSPNMVPPDYSLELSWYAFKTFHTGHEAVKSVLYIIQTRISNTVICTSELRARDDRRRDDRKRRELDRHGKSGESFRDRHERRGGSSRGRSYSRSRSRSRSGSRGKSREREHNQRRGEDRPKSLQSLYFSLNFSSVVCSRESLQIEFI